MNRCGNCKHLTHQTESWEMPHIWWWECAARPAMANLKSFPFHNTKCKSFALSERPKTGPFSLKEDLWLLSKTPTLSP